MDSWLLRDLWLADGTGAPLKRRDVLIAGGRIKAIEPEIAGSAAADRVMRLAGNILAPGFIDAHGHSDLSILAAPEGFSKLSQGVTSEVVGNCGLSAFPLTEINREHLSELYRNYGVELSWHDYAGYRAELAKRGVKLRIHALCGHNSLRGAVLGYEKAEPTPAQLSEMQRLLAEAMSQGALGLSSGLLYVPGKFAGREEITALLETVASHGGVYATHLRSEGAKLLESIEEAAETALGAGLRDLRISHFKTAGVANWGKLDAAMELLNKLRADGLNLTIDRYPYVESMTQLSVVLPGRWEDMDDVMIGRELADSFRQNELAAELANSRPDDYWQGVRITATNAPGGAAMVGKTLAELAIGQKCTPPELAVRLIKEDAAGTSAAFAGMSAENLKRIVALDWCCCGSDENARPATGALSKGHPRAFGSLPRFIRMRLDAGCSIEKAVRQVTGFAAESLHIPDAGKIEVGGLADLVGFDPECIDCECNWGCPTTPASGIGPVFVAGEIIAAV